MRHICAYCNKAYQTGNSIHGRPATLYQGILGLAASIDLLISAEKSEDVVLLMVEPYTEEAKSAP